MSLQPEEICPIPEETIRVARAAFPRGTRYMQMRDELGTIYENSAFAALYPRRGQPAETPWRLALVTVMQFAEELSDREAAEAVRSRIDWKYALALELTDPGFDFSVLSQFRTRLLTGDAQQLLLEAMLTQFKTRGLLAARGKQRTDSTHVLAAVRTLNRLVLLGETLRHCLNDLATVVPDWLHTQASAEWFERYGKRVEDYRLPKDPGEREALSLVVGEDGYRLLSLIYGPTAPTWLCQIPAVQTLRQVWLHHFYFEEEQIRLRGVSDLARSAKRIASPYDVEARFSTKRTTEWVGYKVHLTESCEEEQPRLITNVETTPSTTADVEMLAPIHQALAQKALLPNQHLVDAGYTDAESLATSQREYKVEVLGPVSLAPSWQRHSGEGYEITSFTIDWETKKVSCPNGQLSKSWDASHDGRGNEMIYVQFNWADCKSCEQRALCSRAKERGRALSFRPKEQHEALQAARQRQTTPQFKEAYKLRAGVEGSLSQGVRGFGLRECRYIGLAKTHLQNVITAAALDLVRGLEWLAGKELAKTRVSRFAALATLT